MAENLAVLLQLHQQSIETERQALIAALDLWDSATAVATGVRRSIARETEAAARAGGDDLVEAFAVWLVRARGELTTAEVAESDAEAEVVRRRANLAAVRASARAVEIVLEREIADRQSLATRRTQSDLDEAGLRVRRPE